MEREKCIKYLFNELLNEGIDMKTVAEMLTPMKQINENVCLKINKLIESETSFSCFYEEEWKPKTLIIRDNSDIYYRIEFDYKDYWDGYCMCEPTDEGYNAEHKCCGIACDWCCPVIRIEEVYEIQEVEFEGQERDLWKAIDEFIDEQGDTEKQKKKNKLLSEIEWRKERVEELKELEKELKELEKELGELE